MKMHFSMETEYPVIIPYQNKEFDGILHVPDHAKGIVVFVHGSGSSRLSSRNQFVARLLNDLHLATLLFDLLTPDEEAIDEKTAEYRFNIPFLAERLLGATHWVRQQEATQHLPIGYFGASTGGGAALVAAAELPTEIKAVVSRGGRPDLAGSALAEVQAPTLLIVGGDDAPVIELNQQAFGLLPGVKKLEIVPGATHLFEEPGTLAEVGRLAGEWFHKYLLK